MDPTLQQNQAGVKGPEETTAAGTRLYKGLRTSRSLNRLGLSQRGLRLSHINWPSHDPPDLLVALQQARGALTSVGLILWGSERKGPIGLGRTEPEATSTPLAALTVRQQYFTAARQTLSLARSRPPGSVSL